MQETTIKQPPTAKLVNKAQLLAELFEESSRPSMRWLDYQIAARRIPFVKLGAKIFFSPPDVRTALERKNTTNARK
jgi:hypothetical protein